MDFAGGIWAFSDILVPSTALSILEFKKRSQEPEFRSQEAHEYGLTALGSIKVAFKVIKVISDQCFSNQ
jgi:hypothetical protein